MAKSGVPFWLKPIGKFASSRFGAAIFRRVLHRIDRPLLRWTRGRFATTVGFPTLLLTTTGRKSGQPRSSPLLYIRFGENLAVIGTCYGSEKHPAWYLNLKANPNANIMLHGEEFPVIAREADPREREVIWSQATQVYGGYEKYKARIKDREIPILILSRKTEEP